MIKSMSLLTVEEVADRLGVKVATVYAYVSRGHLRSRRKPDSRRSFFDAREVEELARRGRPRRTTRPSALEFEITTSLTTIADRDVHFRGRSALDMAHTCAFEETAEWLWRGTTSASSVPWESVPLEVPEVPDTRDRLRLAVVLAAAADPMRADPDADAVVARARTLVATMTESVGRGVGGRAARLRLPGRPTPLRGTIAGRLWSGLSPRRATPESVVALNAALVLLADHELAISTLAARVAASGRADPYAIVLAGLGALAGPLHGGASTRAFDVLATAQRDGPERALAHSLATHRHVPGFGHRVYAGGDPRAGVLMNLVRLAYPGHATLTVADRLVAITRRRAQVEPNVDFALAVFAHAAGMPADAGETVFTIARTAGWIAHALEETREPPLRFRARAVPRGSGSVPPESANPHGT